MDLSTLPTVKILVVDDHPNTAIMLGRALSQLGPRVDIASATSGAQALAYVNEGPVDILITDMIMPEMTGLELIERPQSHPSGRPAFSFLITAYEVPGLRVSARRLKVKDVIFKPVHPERICQIIRESIEELDHARPAVTEVSPTKPFTILIADDQPDNVMLLSRYLEREGYNYLAARDGLETLEKVRNSLPDLVLLDINMPFKDGFAVLEEIRSDPATEHIPVIILTAARMDATEIQSGLNMGADDYVTKPFDRRELLARIHTKLRVKQVEDVIRRQNRELNMLPEIGKELSARLNLEELATILLKRTGETLGAMLGHIVIFDNDSKYQQTYLFEPACQAAQVKQPFTLPEPLLEAANHARQGFIVNETQNDPRWSSDETAAARSAVVIPMFGRYHLLGLLLLTNEQVNYFTLEHLLLLQAICSQASIAIENAQLYETMAREQQRLEAVLQSAGEAIFMFDGENRLSLINPAGDELFTGNELKLNRKLQSGLGYDSLLDLLQRVEYSKSPFTAEISWPDQRVFSAAVTPVAVGGAVVVLHDVTHFKHLEKVKDEFIASASHDLRNPITSIRGFSDLIKKAGPLNALQADFADRIQYAAANMGNLVDNMLDLAKMDLGLKPGHDLVEIPVLLLEVADEFQPQVRARGQSLGFENNAGEVKIEGDALQILRALRNLISNSIKYTPDGGSITLSLEQGANEVWIRIRDTGYGIPAADLDFIFNRFYRVRHNGHADIEGNGLGLAIVRSIIEQHGGRVSVDSEPDKGSCFTISLPVAKTESARSEVFHGTQ